MVNNTNDEARYTVFSSLLSLPFLSQIFGTSFLTPLKLLRKMKQWTPNKAVLQATEPSTSDADINAVTILQGSAKQSSRQTHKSCILQKCLHKH
jgi:hypothetical protein